MAKYTIEYKCGHGSFVKELYGKNVERQRYIEWAESNMVCPDCYKAQEKEKDAKAEKKAFLESLSTTKPAILIRVEGQLEANKEALKELGFRWSGEHGGLLNAYFSMKPVKKAFCAHREIKSLEDGKIWIEGMQFKLSELGYSMEISISALDWGMFAKCLEKQADEEAAKQAAIAANPKPARPEWYAAIIKKAQPEAGNGWNGKVYGGKGSRSIYVANEKFPISEAQARELEGYWEKLQAHRKAAA